MLAILEVFSFLICESSSDRRFHMSSGDFRERVCVCVRERYAFEGFHYAVQ